MSSYNPDKWAIVKITHPEHGIFYKVLGGWSGGYLDSDHWRMSSGLKNIEEDEDVYLMHNHSGSVYKCHKKCEGFTALSSYIYNDMKNECKDKEGFEIDTITPEEFIKGTR